MLKNSLESLLDCKEIKPVNPKGNQPCIYSLKALLLKMRRQYFGYVMQRANSLKKTLLLGKIEGKRRRGWLKTKGLDSITNLVDMNFNKLREIVKDREV